MEKKFKLQNVLKVQVLHAPENFTITTTSNEQTYDRILYFVYSLEEMVKGLRSVIAAKSLALDGYLFFIYPKKGNKQYATYLGRDEIFPALQVDDDKYALQSAIKFTSLQSLDDTFSILGMKHAQIKPKKTASSQRVGDYEGHIPEITRFLNDYPKALSLYESLTPGYKKDWARYVFSAKKAETQTHRKQEMIQILEAGFKTKELFKKSNK
ncbi:YdeI/OmpD-associated family protein [Solibacillus sp. MA9]|uniref:YdeI/OmpD-associated family protein n=1 Tax=Solibacillus palustris TaxID=2908203 RepID=A0ABS9UF26_9BACL|nr:YdeI/OmpD-associated family protein [Solibacillus sp. MA9]MCH7322957.1 YdeI/OmpD-associated family protein [Solibacillus sp. MA9]